MDSAWILEEKHEIFLKLKIQVKTCRNVLLWYSMPIFSFIGHSKTDHDEIYKQTKEAFYKSNDVCLQNSVWRKEKY